MGETTAPWSLGGWGWGLWGCPLNPECLLLLRELGGSLGGSGSQGLEPALSASLFFLGDVIGVTL